MNEKIQSWCRTTFVDRDAAVWANAWLCTFFATTSAFQTLKGITDIASDFGGNDFYIQHKHVLAGMCGHAAQSYAESAPFMSSEADSPWAVGGITQTLEPVIMAARLVGVHGARKSLVALIRTLGD